LLLIGTVTSSGGALSRLTLIVTLPLSSVVVVVTGTALIAIIPGSGGRKAAHPEAGVNPSGDCRYAVPAGTAANTVRAKPLISSKRKIDETLLFMIFPSPT
jgi:hypothetical protein